MKDSLAGNVIKGIRHVDYKSHPIKTEIISGGVNHREVKIYLQSQKGHGINSTFVFYGV